MKKNNAILVILGLLIIPFFGFSQIQPTPKSYQKIKFVYQKKSNFRVDEKGFYADTTQFKIMFPDLEYEKISFNAGAIIGFVPLSKLNRLHQKTITKKMTENNTVIFGLVDVKKNKVLFSIDHSSPETDFAYQLFELPQDKLNSAQYYTYKKNFSLLEMNSNATTQVKSVQKNKISWQNEEKTIGQYDSTEQGGNKQLNVVVFQTELPRLVSPIPLFENAKHGVKTIYAMEYHYELIAVSYE
jgi:hypothetical protein